MSRPTFLSSSTLQGGSDPARRVVPGTGGMTAEELYSYRVRAAAALVLSLIERGVIQPDEGAKQEAEPP